VARDFNIESREKKIASKVKYVKYDSKICNFTGLVIGLCYWYRWRCFRVRGCFRDWGKCCWRYRKWV